jgi:hypothetical protein
MIQLSVTQEILCDQARISPNLLQKLLDPSNKCIYLLEKNMADLMYRDPINNQRRPPVYNVNGLLTIEGQEAQARGLSPAEVKMLGRAARAAMAARQTAYGAGKSDEEAEAAAEAARKRTINMLTAEKEAHSVAAEAEAAVMVQNNRNRMAAKQVAVQNGRRERRRRLNGGVRRTRKRSHRKIRHYSRRN